MTSTNTKGLLNVLKGFSSISLEQLNATMSLMERVDKKYIIALKDLGRVMKELTNNYHVLSINNNSLFTYDNIYMDTEDKLFFHQHDRKEKSRLKVRTRHYVESKLAFFECKHKDGAVTRKGRYMIPTQQSLAMSDVSQSFFHGLCTSLCLPCGSEKLHPTMRTLYKRITLCSKKSDERITIDFDIKVQDMTVPGHPLVSIPPVAIIESKSTHNKCVSHHLLKELGYKEISGCSKYCLAMLYTKHMPASKTFASAVKHIQQFDKAGRKATHSTSKALSKVKKSVKTPIKKAASPVKKKPTPLKKKKPMVTSKSLTKISVLSQKNK